MEVADITKRLQPSTRLNGNTNQRIAVEIAIANQEVIFVFTCEISLCFVPYMLVH
jgi:hypothetical protein